MGAPRLTRMRLVALMKDGATFDVTPTVADMTAYDRHRAAHRWPSVEDAPFLAFSWYAWHYLTKTTGQLPAMTYAEWEAAVEWVQSAQDDDEDDEVDPSPRVAGPA